MKKKLINSQLTSYKTYLMYQRRLITLAENVFEFKNLPSFIDKSYLNKTLLLNGSIAFFYDDAMEELVALPYSIIGNLDLYNRPNTIMTRGYNGRFYKRLNRGEFVIMYDNNGRYPIYLDICQIAERIALIKRTQDANIYQQRTPRIWKTTQNKKRSLMDMIDDIDGFLDNIETYDSLDINDIQEVLAPAPYVTDKLDDHLKNEWAEYFQLIGLTSLTQMKKERMIVDEMIASQGGNIASRYNRFEPRRSAIEEINKKWGDKLEEKIEVRYFDGIPDSNESNNESNNEGDDNNVLSMVSDSSLYSSN